PGIHNYFCPIIVHEHSELLMRQIGGYINAGHGLRLNNRMIESEVVVSFQLDCLAGHDGSIDFLYRYRSPVTRK
ncbi:MAG TPA: hypothetical protein PLC40_04905, partial [Candidatus Hydrogenedentes bacterium]|nr:hypothetical protein [Candidatus Hydrogenedentota bacterium]